MRKQIRKIVGAKPWEMRPVYDSRVILVSALGSYWSGIVESNLSFTTIKRVYPVAGLSGNALSVLWPSMVSLFIILDKPVKKSI